MHYGEDYWVIRKGATPAFPGQKGFVGGSMGDISVILEGKESSESKTALYSGVINSWHHYFYGNRNSNHCINNKTANRRSQSG